jgi:sugar/nucleoside kinase (ribokinase family)
MRGGNAVNTASALAALGAEVTPIVCTNKAGLHLLKFHLKHGKIDLSHVKILEKASITTALELEAKESKVNVMLRDVGSLADFGPQHLDDSDFEAIRDADCVCVFNWAGTKRFGTQLAKTVFRHAKAKGKGRTYCDTADPNPNGRKIPELVRSVLLSKDLDVLSLNENEAVSYAKQIGSSARKRKKNLTLEEEAEECAKILASHLSARVDLHTTSFSATFTRKGLTVVPSFRVSVLRATGAGDAWNAGNIIADAHGPSDDCRLTLANAVAAYYVSSPHGEHPTRRQLARFLAKHK